MREVTIEETKRMILYTLDKVISTFLRGSRSMDKLTCVIDLQNIGWDSLDGEALKAILTFLQVSKTGFATLSFPFLLIRQRDVTLPGGDQEKPSNDGERQ
mmetsp:Transcript_7652/g.19630  ORF Transcript_7652/g.19630 Transcript_7652/m.19630 type:complete len:100 (-) Transcript_7652:837-1136(-)